MHDDGRSSVVLLLGLQFVVLMLGLLIVIVHALLVPLFGPPLATNVRASCCIGAAATMSIRIEMRQRIVQYIGVQVEALRVAHLGVRNRLLLC